MGELEIGGMTYATYDSDRDPHGYIGRALADARLEALRVEALEEQFAQLKNETRAVSARAFLNEGCNTSDPRWMQEVLITHFPKRFGPGGSQDLGDYDYRRLYGVYMGVRRSAQKLIRRDSKK
ncbi:hypothetical protein FJZ22_02130 [Candidatus Pacearchaeota archaeon]|nr:hypothetical protein [Candidatus Pacearchaeota archaeon]